MAKQHNSKLKQFNLMVLLNLPLMDCLVEHPKIKIRTHYLELQQLKQQVDSLEILRLKHNKIQEVVYLEIFNRINLNRLEVYLVDNLNNQHLGNKFSHNNNHHFLDSNNYSNLINNSNQFKILINNFLKLKEYGLLK